MENEAVEQCISSLDGESDLALINEINHTIKNTINLRQLKINAQTDTLNLLVNNLNLTKNLNEKEDSKKKSASEKEYLHLSEMEKFEKMKLKESKVKVNLNNEIVELENSLNKLKDDLANLKGEEDRFDELPPDETILKLKLARSLGINMIQDANGNFTKAHISN
ncbi:hypothetical protein HDU92_005990 [Lobulomyces angularis]|nr:hypothetical protein HDU92_005990 [Lobulomyces angularis]